MVDTKTIAMNEVLFPRSLFVDHTVYTYVPYRMHRGTAVRAACSAWIKHHV